MYREETLIAPARLVAPEAWLAALFDPQVVIRGCGSFCGQVAGDWTTRPRHLRRTEVHYLFCAPQAAMQVELADGAFEAAPRSLLWFPPGLSYGLSLRSRRRQEGLLRIRFQMISDGCCLTPFTAPHVVPRPDRFADICARLEAEWVAQRPWRDQAARTLLSELGLLALRSGDGSAGRVLESAQVEAVLHYAAKHVTARPSPSDLAAVLGLAPSYFTRLFTATFGCSPRSWLLTERIQHAAERLRSCDHSIGAVAEEYGYDNPFLFSRQFSHVMGLSPRAWRSSQ
jgi:AraC-like DNA-binding protein